MFSNTAHRAGRLVTFAVAGLAAATILTGCTQANTPGPSSSGGARGETLTYGFSAPASLDPKDAINGQPGVYINVAYANLIEIADDGTLVPGLAESWGYVGDGNTAFEITLKPGLKFANGEDITAEAVANSINYFKTGSSSGASNLTDATATATGDLTVEITSETPNPALPVLLSSAWLGGAIIAPEGLKDPEKLATETFGAGPYTLNSAETTPNNTYTFDANPNYWDQSALHWDQFVIKSIGQSASQLQALQAGQIDFMGTYDYQMGQTAEAAGFEVYSKDGQAWDGIHLMDHSGAVTPALADVRVRQALNYAIDRDAIATSILGSVGAPTAGVSLPSWLGYSESTETAYDFDPDKARDLLAEAGYGDGFSFAVTYQGNGSATDRMVQAVAQYFSEIGVTMELKPATNFGELFGNIFSKEVAASEITVSTFNPWTMWHQQWIDGPMAVFGDLDPELKALFDEAAAAPVDASDELWQAANTALIEEYAWTIPVMRWNTQYIVSPEVEGMVTNPLNGLPDYLALRPAD